VTCQTILRGNIREEIFQVVLAADARRIVRNINRIIGLRDYFLAPTKNVSGAVYLKRFADEAKCSANANKLFIFIEIEIFVKKLVFVQNCRIFPLQLFYLHLSRRSKVKVTFCDPGTFKLKFEYERTLLANF